MKSPLPPFKVHTSLNTLNDAKRRHVLFNLEYDIAEFLVSKNYTVVGVNPLIKKSGSIDVYPTLKDVPFEIDIVNVFRRSETIPEIIEEVLSVNPKALWLQQGIRNDDAVKPVMQKWIQVIQDKCIAVYYNLCKTF